MKLYGFPPSPRTWAVRAVAAQLGIPVEFEFVDLTKGQQHAAEYRALNPPAARRLWSTATSNCGKRRLSCTTSPARS